MARKQTVDVGGATVVFNGNMVESVRPFDAGRPSFDDAQPFYFRGRTIWASDAFELGREIASQFGAVELTQGDFVGLDLDGHGLAFARGQVVAGVRVFGEHWDAGHVACQGPSRRAHISAYASAVLRTSHHGDGEGVLGLTDASQTFLPRRFRDSGSLGLGG